MRALLLKEFRNQLPFFFLVILCGLLDFLFFLIARYPDQVRLSESIDSENIWAYTALLSVLSFSLGIGLLQREFEDNTIEFLNALPTSRAHVFAAKFVVGLSVLFLLPVLALLTAVLLNYYSRTSLDPSFHWNLFLGYLFLEWILCFVCLAIGFSLSFLKGFAWLIAALLAWSFLIVDELNVKVIDYFNFLSLLEPSYMGQQLLFPIKQIVVQMALAFILITLSFLIFNFKGYGSWIGFDRFLQSRFAKVLLVLGTVTAVILWAFWITKKTSDDSDVVKYVRWNKARAITEQYELLYHSNISGRVKQLISFADSVYREVGLFFDTNMEHRIVVDLTGKLQRHAGKAYWKKAIIDLSYSESTEELRAVLTHETTHIFIDSVSQSKLYDEFNSTRFFHEGLATYLEYGSYSSSQEQNELRIRSAAARWMNQVRIEELADSEVLTEKYDTDLVYPLGELFVSVLVDQYGKEAPLKIVQAFGRKDAPENLTGLALWQDVFQSCNYNFNETVNRFYAKLDSLVAENRQFLNNLPRLKGAVVEEEYYVGIRPVYKGKIDGELMCRFRDRNDSEIEDYIYSWLEKDVFWVESDEFSGRSFWYQLGITPDGYSSAIYEQWVEIRQ